METRVYFVAFKAIGSNTFNEEVWLPVTEDDDPYSPDLTHISQIRRIEATLEDMDARYEGATVIGWKYFRTEGANNIPE